MTYVFPDDGVIASGDVLFQTPSDGPTAPTATTRRS